MNDLPAGASSLYSGVAGPAVPGPGEAAARETADSGGEPGKVIVLGNEKGGTGKSTTAMHLIVALLRGGNSVASVDLDGHQGTLTRYIENRRNFAGSESLRLQLPEHHRVAGGEAERHTESSQADALIDRLAAAHDYVVLDCPGTDNALARHAISRADILITPVNDSFIDLDLLARIGGTPPRVLGPSVYSQTVWEGRQRRAMSGGRPIDWIVLRNRLSPLESRNKKSVGLTLDELARRIGCRCLDGFHERVIFRQLFLQGLTVLDLREEGAGVALNMSHVAARQEIRRLADAVLDRSGESTEARPAVAEDAEPVLPGCSLPGPSCGRQSRRCLEPADFGEVEAGQAAPKIERLRHWRQGPRRAGAGLRELLHAEAEFDGHAVRIEEIEENAAGRRMAARPVDDLDIVLLESVERPADIVDVGHHEIDMVQPVLVGPRDPQRVVEPVRETAQEGDHAVDLVGQHEAEVAHQRIPHRRQIRRGDDDMAEPGDPGEARPERVRHPFHAGEIFEQQPGAGMAEAQAAALAQCGALGRVEPARRVAAALQVAEGAFEIVFGFEFEADPLQAGLRRLAEQDIVMVRPAAQRRLSVRRLGRIEADDVRIEGEGAGEVGDVERRIAEPAVTIVRCHLDPLYNGIPLHKQTVRRDYPLAPR